MLDLTFLNHYAPIWIMIIATILIYAALKTIKLPGSDAVLALLSFIVSFMFVSSTAVVNYIADTIPVLMVLMTLGFIVLLILSLVAVKLESFRKPLAIVLCVWAAILIISMAFSHFAVFSHMLPDSSNSGLNSGMVQLKDLIYSDGFKDSLVFVIAIVVCSILMLKKIGT